MDRFGGNEDGFALFENVFDVIKGQDDFSGKDKHAFFFDIVALETQALALKDVQYLTGVFLRMGVDELIPRVSARLNAR